MFKIGDEIKLKDYTKHSDWKAHTDQIATIDAIQILVQNSLGYNCSIRWPDKTISRAPENAFEPVCREWESEFNIV